MTEDGLEKLKRELEELESTKRTNAKQRIKHARSFCDFGEDPEYDTAVKELETIEKRITEIKLMIQQADIIRKTDTTTVELGNKVSFQEIPGGEVETYMIVGPEEADPSEGKISRNTPIAKSLLSAKINDKVTAETPDGKRVVKITDIS